MADDKCSITGEVHELTASVKLLTERVDNLIQLNRDIIKWLLIVVCIIALGRGAMDLFKDFYLDDAKKVVVGAR